MKKIVVGCMIRFEVFPPVFFFCKTKDVYFHFGISALGSAGYLGGKSPPPLRNNPARDWFVGIFSLDPYLGGDFFRSYKSGKMCFLHKKLWAQ